MCITYPANNSWTDSITKQVRYENLNGLGCGAPCRNYSVLCVCACVYVCVCVCVSEDKLVLDSYSVHVHAQCFIVPQILSGTPNQRCVALTTRNIKHVHYTNQQHCSDWCPVETEEEFSKEDKHLRRKEELDTGNKQYKCSLSLSTHTHTHIHTYTHTHTHTQPLLTHAV